MQGFGLLGSRVSGFKGFGLRVSGSQGSKIQVVEDLGNPRALTPSDREVHFPDPTTPQPQTHANYNLLEV